MNGSLTNGAVVGWYAGNYRQFFVNNLVNS